MKCTVVAPSNIAFIKYWGKKDEVLRLPENGSVSMCLSNLLTTTTVKFDEKYNKDEIIFDEEILKQVQDDEVRIRVQGDRNRVQDDNVGKERIIKHLDRIRKMAGKNIFAKVSSVNNFPVASGLASSASGFAALTMAGTKAIGLNLSEKELSILARQGSGSACRSIPDGFVEWLDGNSSETSFAVSLYPADYWNILDIVAVVGEEKKDISSTEGQKLIKSNLFFQTRLSNIKNKIEKIKKSIENKNFTEFGEMIETEALELHALLLTTKPPLIYWNEGTLKIIKNIQKWRNEGVEAYLTIDAGPQVHIFCEETNKEKLEKFLKEMPEVKKIIVNKPAVGARIIGENLF